MKNISFLSENFQFSEVTKFSIYLNRRVFVMVGIRRVNTAAFFSDNYLHDRNELLRASITC